MRTILISIALLCSFIMNSQTPGKDSLFLFLEQVMITKKDVRTGANGVSDVYVKAGFRLGNGPTIGLSRKANNLYQIVKINPAAAKKIKDHRKYKRQWTGMFLADLVFVGTALGGLALMTEGVRERPLRFVSGVGLAAVSAGVVLSLNFKFMPKKSKQIQEALKESVEIYNSGLLVK